MAFYPMYVDLAGKKCVVVGGGDVAERKVVSLLQCGADVELISPEVTPQLERLERLVEAGSAEGAEGAGGTGGRLRVKRRAYEPGDLAGATLAIVATDSEAVNRDAHREATDNRIPVNVVDVPELCSFIVPSTIRRGDLIISISTSGSCPALAKSIRKRLEHAFGEEYEAYCNILKNFRREVADTYEEPEERKRALNRFIIIESDILELIRAGKIQELEERVRSCM